MGITHIPQQVASTVQDAAGTLKYQGTRLLDQDWDKNWVRTVAAGSLVTGQSCWPPASVRLDWPLLLPEPSSRWSKILRA